MPPFSEPVRRQRLRRALARYDAKAEVNDSCIRPVRSPRSPVGCSRTFSLGLSDSNPCFLVSGEFERLLQLQRVSYRKPLQRFGCRAVGAAVFENHPSLLPPEILSHPPCGDSNLRLRHFTGLFHEGMKQDKGFLRGEKIQDAKLSPSSYSQLPKSFP